MLKLDTVTESLVDDEDHITSTRLGVKCSFLPKHSMVSQVKSQKLTMELELAKKRAAVQKASNALANMKAFMKQYERNAKEKILLEEKRRIEEKPTEDLRETILLLNNKVERRDETIRSLRNSFMTEILHTKVSSAEEVNSRFKELNQFEKEKFEELSDENASLLEEIEKQKTDIEMFKSKLQAEREKLISIAGLSDKIELGFKEKALALENDLKDVTLIVKTQDNNIERLGKELTRLEAELQVLNADHTKC